MNALDHCGPIRYPGRTVIIDPDGIQTQEDTNDTVDPSPEQWLANWIWLNPDAFPDHQAAPYTCFCEKTGKKSGVGLFRKTFFLDTKPEKVAAWVSGDTKYRLYMNGKMAGHGPAEVGGDCAFFPPKWLMSSTGRGGSGAWRTGKAPNAVF